MLSEGKANSLRCVIEPKFHVQITVLSYSLDQNFPNLIKDTTIRIYCKIESPTFRPCVNFMTPGPVLHDSMQLGGCYVYFV
jgi:hypothetical protein